MGQHLQNAPLYFTIAQVRFNPILNLEAFLPQLQEKLRKAGYPDYKAMQRFVLTLSATTGKEEASATESRFTTHSFANMEGTSGFVLGPESLSFQTTRYDTIDHFANELFKGLAIVHDAVELSYYESLGLRYLDAVIPRAGEDLGQYLVAQVLGLSEKLPGLQHSYMESMAEHEGNRVTSRIIIQDGKVALPPDLASASLKIETRFTEPEGRHAIIDNDAVYQGREAFDIDRLQSRLKALRALIDIPFTAIIQQHAKTVWEGK